MNRRKPNPAYVGPLTFVLGADSNHPGEVLGTEQCTGARDAKSHAAHLAVTYGCEIDIRSATGSHLASVTEDYLNF